MNERVTCFWLAPIARVRRALRRYVFGEGTALCPLKAGYHNALNVVDEKDQELAATITIRSGEGEFPHDDPRWPKACGCGYAFGEQDHRQLFVDRLFRRDDTGESMTLDEAPPGAMYDADHYKDVKGMVGADGLSLVVKLPDGSSWCVDGPASSGTRWTRTGTPPRITVLPSILTPRYHGHLVDGVLVSC